MSACLCRRWFSPCRIASVIASGTKQRVKSSEMVSARGILGHPGASWLDEPAQ